jgi:uncharacterized protein
LPASSKAASTLLVKAKARLRTIRIINTTRSCTLGDAIECADTGRARNIGLLGRKGLPKGGGLWIVPTEAIHTFFMRFDIDVLFLDRKKRVLKAVRRMRPWRIAMSWRAHTVLELPPGTIEETGTSPGDVLEIIRPGEAAGG